MDYIKEATAHHPVVLLAKSTHCSVHEKTAGLEFKPNDLGAQEYTVGFDGSELYSSILEYSLCV